MKDFKQNDNRWANQTFINGYTFKSYGCFLVSLADLCDIEPPQVADVLRNDGRINAAGYLQNPFKIAELLGLEYNGISTTQPDYPTIAETLYYDKASTPPPEQHFFVIFPDGSQYDPLGKNIKYPIESYRLFKAKESEVKVITDLTKSILIRQDGKAGVYAITPIPSPEALEKDYKKGDKDVLVYKPTSYFAGPERKCVITAIPDQNEKMFEFLHGDWNNIKDPLPNMSQYISKVSHEAIVKKAVLDAVSSATQGLLTKEECDKKCESANELNFWGHIKAAFGIIGKLK